MDSKTVFPIELLPLQPVAPISSETDKMMAQYVQQMQQMQQQHMQQMHQMQQQMLAMATRSGYMHPFFNPVMAGWMRTPEPFVAPEPIKAPEPPKAPEPIKAPEPPKAPEPIKAPEPPKAPKPTKILPQAVLTPAQLTEATKPAYTPPHKRGDNAWIKPATKETRENLITHDEFVKRYPVGINPRNTDEFKWLQSVIEKYKIKFAMKTKNGINKNCSFKNEEFPHFTFCVNYVENSKAISCIIFYDNQVESDYDGLIVRMIEFYDEGGVRRYSIYNPASKHYHVALYTRDTGELYKVIVKTKLNSFDKDDIISITDVIPRKSTI